MTAREIDIDDYDADDFADEFELAHIERSVAHIDALDDVFERWP